MLGSDAALAEHLGIDAATLAMYMADNPPLPDPLLLRAVDIVLADDRYRVVAESSQAVARKSTEN
jgi:hypothetical protein